MCKKRSKKMMSTEAQETLDLNAMHNINEVNISITIDSAAAVPAMLQNMLPIVPGSGETGSKFCRVADGSKIPHLGCKRITIKVGRTGPRGR